MQKELDTILYFHEIKTFVQVEKHYLIEKIINEERKHFSKLKEMKKALK